MGSKAGKYGKDWGVCLTISSEFRAPGKAKVRAFREGLEGDCRVRRPGLEDVLAGEVPGFYGTGEAWVISPPDLGRAKVVEGCATGDPERLRSAGESVRLWVLRWGAPLGITADVLDVTVWA